MLVLDEAAGFAGENLAVLRVLEGERLLQQIMVIVAADWEATAAF